MANISGRKFNGIWIPAALWLTKGLSPNLKVLLVEIDSLDNGERGCFASNAYFANFLQVSESQASRLINTLVKKGLISSRLINGNGRNNERRLHVLVPINEAFSDEVVEQIQADEGIRKNAEGVSAKVQKGSKQKCGEGIRKNAEDNKPSNKPVNKPVISKAEKDSFTSSLDNDFKTFWKVYPNKKSGPSKAKESFIRVIKKGVSLGALLRSIAEHSHTRSWIDGYVPHATTWLNQGRYEAEFAPADFMQPQASARQASQNRLADNAGLDALLDGDRFASARVVNDVPGIGYRG